VDKDALIAAIATAEAVASDTGLNQVEIDTAVVALDQAASLFAHAVIPAYVYKTATGLVDITRTNIDDYGSTTVIDLAYTAEAAYNPCIKLDSPVSSWGGDPYCVVAFKGMSGVLTSRYKSLIFKYKNTSVTSFAFIINDDKTIAPESLSGLTSYTKTLPDGWMQVLIPLSDFIAEGKMPAEISGLFIGFEPAPANSVYVTDLGFSEIDQF